MDKLLSVGISKKLLLNFTFLGIGWGHKSV